MKHFGSQAPKIISVSVQVSEALQVAHEPQLKAEHKQGKPDYKFPHAENSWLAMKGPFLGYQRKGSHYPYYQIF